MLISQICQYFLLKKCEKLLQCKSFSHFFSKAFAVQKLLSFFSAKISVYLVGLNNILFIQISPAKHVHTKFIEDLNESILLIEFIYSFVSGSILFYSIP